MVEQQRGDHRPSVNHRQVGQGDHRQGEFLWKTLWRGWKEKGAHEEWFDFGLVLSSVKL